MQDFKQLKVWQKAHQLVLAVYQASSDFPQSEIYGLTSQMRRCSVSIPANIAEGCGKESNADLARFLYIASGSASELEYHLLLARDLTYIPESTHFQLSQLLSEVRKMLFSFIDRVKNNQ